ncbi:chymotrypsin family serine protease [Pseudorhodobacter aquimaris]|uniref:hypothetical protein n=1 Tax=Pseudorhodobacter aquimaris TaxID=687412 RepID=UPI000AD5EC96|nr:hypothetical protein [Pseudorhodobacter aquimaris]
MSLYAFLVATEGSRISENASYLLEAAEVLSNWYQTSDDPAVRRYVFGLGISYLAPGADPSLLVLVDNTFLRQEVDQEASVAENLRSLESLSSALELFPSFISPNDLIRRLNCQILPIETEERHAAPGDKIYFFPPDGRLGAAVRWGPHSGYLTAGHVARRVNAMAVGGGGATIGPVLWQNDPGRQRHPSKDVDVAIIEALAHVTVNGLGTGRHFPGSGEPLDLAATAKSDAVFGFCDFVRFGPARATYGEVFITEKVFSRPGDSGGLVTSGGRTVGSLIGAYNQRNTSVVQSIGYQLQEIRARGGPNLQL